MSRSPSCLSSPARWWNVSARSAGPPTVRACASIAATSRPVLLIRATVSPVTASATGLPSSGAAYQRPAA
jgi:hypothetical protein